MHQDWLATVSRDLRGQEGFGLVATSRDPSTTDITAFANRIPADFGWALQWSPSAPAGASDNPLPNGAMFKFNHQGSQVLGWKFGGFRDQRGREGAIAVQLFRFEREERCEPELLTRIAGTALLPRDHAKVGPRDAPLSLLTPEAFRATARQPSAALATDANLHQQVADVMEALVFGQRQVTVGTPDVDLFWEGFWAIMPHEVAAEISASTAEFDREHAEFQLIIHAGDADPSARSELTDFVHAALRSYANGRELDEIPAQSTLADFVAWIRQQNLLTYRGLPYLSNADFLLAVAEDPAGHSTIDQNGLYDALSDERVPAELHASVTRALARSADPKVTEVVSYFAKQRGDTRLAALLLQAGHRDAASHLAKARWSTIGPALTEAGSSAQDVDDFLQSTANDASTEELCKGLDNDDPPLDSRVLEAALAALGSRAWEGDSEAATYLLDCAAAPRTEAVAAQIAELRRQPPTPSAGASLPDATMSPAADAWRDDGRWEKLVYERRFDFAKKTVADILKVPGNDVFIEVRSGQAVQPDPGPVAPPISDPTTHRQRPDTPQHVPGTPQQNRGSKAKDGPKQLYRLLLIMLMLFVFAVLVSWVISRGSGDDVTPPSEDSEVDNSVDTDAETSD